jgi:HAD superfamily hydrolase (TIGR01490 family)
MSARPGLWRAPHTDERMSEMEAAFFDLDKTIVARSSPLALGKSFFREGLISRPFFLKSLYAQLLFQLMGADEEKMERMRREASRITQGWEQERVKQVVTEVLEEVISPLIYAEALERMHDHRAAGRLVCMVSSSPQEIVEPMARMLQVDRFIATRPRIVDGKYTGDLDFYAYGPHKAAAIQALAEEPGLDLQGSYAYSDSATDLPMLEVVGNPVTVNPDKALRRIAIERDWTIEVFRNPVTLRDRLPQLRAPELNPAGAVAAAVGVAGIAAAAWWITKKSTRRSG